MYRLLPIAFLTFLIVAGSFLPSCRWSNRTGLLVRAADDRVQAIRKIHERDERGGPHLKEKPIAFFRGDEKHGINSLAFSPDSKLVAAAAGMDGSTIRVWDLSEKKEKLVLRDDTMGSWSVRFSRTGKILMTASMGKNFDVPYSLALWDASNGKQLKLFPLLASPSGVCLTPDGKFAVASVQGPADRPMPFGVAFINIETGKAEFDFLGHGSGSRAFVISADGSLLATGGDDKMVKIWDVKMKKELFYLKPDMEEITALAFSPDATVLAVASTPKRQEELAGKHPPDLKLYDVRKHEELNYIPPFGRTVRQVAYCPRQPCLGVLCGVVYLLNIKNGALLVVRPDQQSSFTTFAFSPDGEFLAVGDDQGAIRIWKTPRPDFK